MQRVMFVHLVQSPLTPRTCHGMRMRMREAGAQDELTEAEAKINLWFWPVSQGSIHRDALGLLLLSSTCLTSSSETLALATSPHALAAIRKPD